MFKSLPAKNVCIVASCLVASGLLLACSEPPSDGDVQTTATAASVPDFYENGVGWVSRINDFYPPKSGLATVSYHPEHPYFGRSGQSFRVANLDHPALMPWVKEVMKKKNDEVLAGSPLYTVANSCRPSGVPNILLLRSKPFFFVQTPEIVYIIWQNDQMVRRIYLNQEHSENPKPSWFGQSVGHYENGDTLVVDTVGLNIETTIDNYHTPHTEQLHVVERFHKVGNTMEIEITVEDPGAFTEPMYAMQIAGRVDFTTSPPETEELDPISPNGGPYLREEICAEVAPLPVDIGIPAYPQDDTPDF